MRDTLLFKENFDFILFGFQHIAALLVFTLFGIILIRKAKKLPEVQQIKIGNIFAFSLSIIVILWTLIKIYDRGFDIKQDLPFHLCNFIALLLPTFTLTRNKLYYEILLFWILAGTTQAIITPDLVNGFPHYHYIKYWLVHGGLIVFIFYATFIYDMRPTLKSVGKSFFALLVYFIFMLIINKITNANYLYINHKPEGDSVLNYLGEWPYYVFIIIAIVIPYFLIIYLPFYLTRKKLN